MFGKTANLDHVFHFLIVGAKFRQNWCEGGSGKRWAFGAGVVAGRALTSGNHASGRNRVCTAAWKPAESSSDAEGELGELGGGADILLDLDIL